MYVLMKWKWSEGDLEGFVIITKENSDLYKSIVEDIDDNEDVCYLSEDDQTEIYYDNGKELLKDIFFIEINQEERNVYLKSFGISWNNHIEFGECGFYNIFSSEL